MTGREMIIFILENHLEDEEIIQDGKIVGAVTHVLVDSVKKGYGLYMDFMLEKAKQVV